MGQAAVAAYGTSKFAVEGLSHVDSSRLGVLSGNDNTVGKVAITTS